MPRPHYQTRNSKSQTTFRQKLRHTPTATEQILWNQLKQSQLGVKFRRQHGVGKYVLDFYAPQLKLAIELDSDSHFQPGKQQRDFARDKQIQTNGITVLRFTDTQVLQDLDSVIQTIQECIDSKKNLPVRQAGHLIPARRIGGSPINKGETTPPRSQIFDTPPAQPSPS